MNRSLIRWSEAQIRVTGSRSIVKISRIRNTACTLQTLLPLVQEYPTTQLKSHVYEAHKMAAYRFQCGFCPKKFDTKAHIKVHTRQALQTADLQHISANLPLLQLIR
jgi:hypothetical protein